ncbi:MULTISPECIES: hypothetical protein [unclassified Helicobacter]|uniref:hypothetical protein n=1 Tax=unclassified Helicobacter TaxID=2593540 RepID=UPI0012E6F2C6|nr:MULTISPECIES: hypothetical protein [unclassified Helicobacter]
MEELNVKDLKEQIIDMEDRLDEFVEEMQKRISALKNALGSVEAEKSKAKDYER